MNARAPRLWAVAVALSLTAASMPAWAEPSAADRALAQALFKDGRRLIGEGKIDEACAKFAESQKIVPQIGTLLNLASCHAKQGKVATASAELSSVISQASKAGDTEREAAAREELDKIANKIPKVIISAEVVPAGLEVRLDGTAMGAAALGSQLPIDPGDHEIVASAPGKVPSKQKIQIPVEPTTTIVKIPPLADEPKAPPPAPPPEAPPDRSMRTVGFIALGVGVVGVGLGTFFGVKALSTKGDANCPDKLCRNQAELDKIDKAQGFATISTVSFLIGAIGVGAGAYFILKDGTSPKSKSETPTALRLSPLVGATGGGFSLSADW